MVAREDVRDTLSSEATTARVPLAEIYRDVTFPVGSIVMVSAF